MSWEYFHERRGEWMAVSHDGCGTLDRHSKGRAVGKACLVEIQNVEYKVDVTTMTGICVTNPHKSVTVRKGTGAGLTASPSPSPTKSPQQQRSGRFAHQPPPGQLPYATDRKAAAAAGGGGGGGFDLDMLDSFVEEQWSCPDGIQDMLMDFIRIRNQSPEYDSDWDDNGLQMDAAELLAGWAKRQDVAGMDVEILKHEKRTPLILITVDAFNFSGGSTVYLYGHFDKQPPMAEAWDPDKGGPWDPVIIGEKMYGRGGADDGYAIFAALTGIQALQRQGVAHPRYVITIEGSEESGSVDLPHYIDFLADVIGAPDIVICLDSGAKDYDRLWCTASLRGILCGSVTVSLLTEDVHSGQSGVVASSFRVLRQLLDRIEDSETGKILIPSFHTDITEDVMEGMRIFGADGDPLFSALPTRPGVRPMSEDPVEQALWRGWRPTLSVTGMSGLPDPKSAGNVLRAGTTAKLSIRLPPGVDADRANETLERILTTDVPSGAHVTWDGGHAGQGFRAPPLAPWLRAALDEASTHEWGKPMGTLGEGGSIPFMNMLQLKFPDAQFAVLGLLGPASNAHGPNEFMHIPVAKKLTSTVAVILQRHAGQC